MSVEDTSMEVASYIAIDDPVHGIVYKMDSVRKKALIRIMIEQDLYFFPTANCKQTDISHLYVPFDYMGNGETDIELGTIIEILEFKGRCFPAEFHTAVMFTNKRPVKITAYSVVSVERKSNQLVTVTSCEKNYLNVVGEAYGSFSGLVGYPINCNLTVWRNLAKGSFLYGDVIELPKFYGVVVNNQLSLEIYFDHKACLESICDKKPTSFGQKLLTRIRLPTFIEIEEIIRTKKNGYSELAEKTLILMFASGENPDIPGYLKIMADNKMYELKEKIEMYLIEISNSRNLCDLVDLLDMANCYYLDKVSMHIDDFLVDIYTENIDDTECRNEIIFYCLVATQHCYLPEILDELEKFLTSMLSESLETLENSYKSLVGIEIWDSSLSQKVSVAAEFEDRITGFVCYMFGKAEKSHLNLVRFLNFAQIGNIITLKHNFKTVVHRIEATENNGQNIVCNLDSAACHNLATKQSFFVSTFRDGKFEELIDELYDNQTVLTINYGNGDERSVGTNKTENQLEIQTSKGSLSQK